MKSSKGLGIDTSENYYDKNLTPKEEFIHSVYIVGVPRTNEEGIEEKYETISIRGVQYNLKEFYMIPMHIKSILSKNHYEGKKKYLDCYSYKVGAPGEWKGTSGRVCGANAQERSADDYCKPCKNQLIVLGLFCDENGKPITKDGKPVPVFIRGEGTKYSFVNDYLNELYNMDTTELPILNQKDEEEVKYEKKNINHKKVITKVTVGHTTTNYGVAKVFNFEKVKLLDKEKVEKIIALTKKIIPKFDEKFANVKPFVKKTNTSSNNQNSNQQNDYGDDVDTSDQSSSQDNSSSLNDIDF